MLRVGVDGGGEYAGDDTDGPAEQREQDRLGEELRADVALGRAERATEADLGAALEDAR